MPIFDDYSDPGQTRIGYIPPQPKPADPSVWDTVKAGAALELDMVNLWQSMSAPKFKPQDGFEIGPTLRNYDAENSTSYFEDYRDRLIGVSSDDEFNYQIEKIKKEEEYRRTLAASGTLGILAQIGAGIVSPTVFLPFVGQSRGLAAVAKAVGYSFFGAGIQEGILYQNQITRTPEEVMFSLAASTALGGILGSAHVMLRPHEKQLFASHLEEAAREARGETLPVKVGDEVVPGAKPLEGEPTHIAARVENEPAPVVLKGAEDIRAERAAPTPALTRAQEIELREAVFQVAGPEVRVRFQEIIKLVGKAADTAAQEWGTAAAYASGKWSPEQDLITLSRTHADLGTAYHEAFHRLQDLLLDQQEKGVLNKSRARMEQLVAEKHPVERISKMSDREVQAEAFSEWMRKGATEPPPSGLERLWNGLKSMMQRVGNLINGFGFQNADDIFKKAAAGDIAKRAKSAEVPTAPEAAQVIFPNAPKWLGRFLSKFMTTGEGTQEFGWGLYFAAKKGNAENQLDYNLPLDQQPKGVQEALLRMDAELDMSITGEALVAKLDVELGGPKAASTALRVAGVSGHVFSNPFSKSRHYVVYETEPGTIKEYFQQNFRPTETPEFQRWFRNSKVVDAEGNPTVMYTGTSKDVDFDKFKAPKNGIWFTPSKEVASDYSMSNDSMGFKRDGWNFVETNTASRVIPVYLAVQNPKVLTAWPDEVMGANYKKADAVLFDKYKAEGFDGVLQVDENGNIIVAVAFDPKQIKSVYNKGAWAPTDPRISYQIASEPEDRVGGLARGAQTWAKVTDATKVLTNPVTQTINQTTFGTARDIARKMADSGLAMEGNMKEHYDENGNLLYTTHVPTTELGTIENRIPEYWGMFDQATRKVNDIYADYIYNGKPPKLFPGTRASIASRSRGKLAFWEFSRAVARTIFNGFETAPNEHVLEAARAVHDGFYKPIFDRAVEVGLLDADMKLVGDKAYLNRVYNITAINANPQKFIKILQDHFETKHRESMEADIKKYLAEKASEEQFLEDALLTADDYNALSARLTEAEKNIEETLPEPVREIEEQLQGLRTAAKAAKKLGDDAEYDRLWGEAKQMEKDNYHLLKDSRDAKAAVRRRLKNLSRGVVAATKEQEKQLTKLEKTFSKNMDGLRRVARMAQQILPKLGRLSDKELDAQVSKLRNMFAGVANDYDRLVERATVVAADPEMGPSLYLDQLMMKKADRLTELTAKLQVAEGADRVTLRADIEEGLNLVMEKVNEINTTRSIRAAKAVAKADELDPAAKAKALEDQRGQIKFNEMDFVRQLEERGAEGVDLSTGTVNVRELALRDAEEFKNTVTGTMLHLPVVEVMALERGPELLRMLDIPSTQIEEFLEFDINKLMRMYTRTFAPDIEITRTFGTVNFADIWKPVEEELDKLSRQLHQVHGHNPEYEGKKQTALRAEYDQYKLNVRAMYERLRGLRGLPSNPDDIAWRGAKLVADFNVLRQMGMVLSASLPDVGRPIIRYGLTRTMKDGIIPMITNFQQFKLSALEAVYSGAAVDTSAHLRSTGFHDTMDDLMRGTKFERAVSYLSTHMGILALFDIWTDKMKLITGAISNGKIMESLATVNGVEGYMPMAKAMDFLAQNSISGSMAEAMWREITENGGGQRINGVWWPNTKSWINPEAVRTYRQMLAREVNNTIVTPGIDKPLYADVNMVGRLLYQFKSFGLASNSRIVMSGLQQQDAAVLNGVLVSLAMGAVSYAAWATLTGGKAYEDMRNASAEKWIDEMIQRSGLFGALGEVQRVGQTVPALSPYMSLSNTKSTRRPGDNLVESLLGPSFGLLQEAGNVIGGLHEPTQATAHALRKMMPFQQTMILREIWDAFEAGLAHVLPERRTP